MAIGALLRYPETPAEFYTWSFAHMANHRDIIRRIFEETGQNLTEYVLDPFDPQSMIDQHQTMHNEMDRVLGISGYDLTVLDWSDPDSRSTWLAQNQNEHYIASSILGIG